MFLIVRLLVGLGITLALIVSPLATVLASELSGSFHWARQSPTFTLQVGNNLDSRWSDMLHRTINDWNKNDVATFRIVTGGSNPQDCRSRTGRVEICNWRYGTQTGWLGLARIYFDESGEHIEAATAQLNDSFFDQDDGRYNSDAARLHTICHELGHTLGLGHPDTPSCMNHSQYSVFNHVAPSKRDFREIAAIYSHTDSSTTMTGKQKPNKEKGKNKDNKAKKNKKGKKNKNSKSSRTKDQKRHRSDRQGQPESRKNAKNTVDASSFFSPTALPAVPSGLTGDQTVIVEQSPDGRRVVSIVTWAIDEAAE